MKNLIIFLFFALMQIAYTQNTAPEIEWAKCYGGSSFDYAESIQQTSDGGYIIAGSTESNDCDITGDHGDFDYWIVKLNSSGNIQWQKSLGGSDDDEAYSIQQTNDGGYIIAGLSGSNDGNVTGNHGDWDYCIVKLNSSGNIEWQECLGGSSNDYAISIQQTNDGGYIVAGSSESSDGDVTGNHGHFDCWLVKLNFNGNIQWEKCIGGSDGEGALSIQQTTDSGYIVAGYSSSEDGDVTGNNGASDYWIVILNSSGNIERQKSLGGSSIDYANSIRKTSDGGYIVAGWSISNDGDVIGNHGKYDYWLVKLDLDLNIKWQKCLGGKDNDAHSILQTSDDDYIVAGSSESSDGDVAGNHGGWDFWIVKLKPESTEVAENNSKNNSGFSISPNPVTDNIQIFISEYLFDKSIEIYNITGIKVFEENVNNTIMQINIESLPAGVYFIRIGNETKIFVKK